MYLQSNQLATFLIIAFRGRSHLVTEFVIRRDLRKILSLLVQFFRNLLSYVRIESIEVIRILVPSKSFDSGTFFRVPIGNVVLCRHDNVDLWVVEVFPSCNCA